MHLVDNHGVIYIMNAKKREDNMNATNSAIIIGALIIGIYLLIPSKQIIPVEKENYIFQPPKLERRYELYFNQDEIYLLNCDTGTVKHWDETKGRIGDWQIM